MSTRRLYWTFAAMTGVCVGAVVMILRGSHWGWIVTAVASAVSALATLHEIRRAAR